MLYYAIPPAVCNIPTRRPFAGSEIQGLIKIKKEVTDVKSKSTGIVYIEQTNKNQNSYNGILFIE